MWRYSRSPSCISRAADLAKAALGAGVGLQLGIAQRRMTPISDPTAQTSTGSCRCRVRSRNRSISARNESQLACLACSPLAPWASTRMSAVSSALSAPVGQGREHRTAIAASRCSGLEQRRTRVTHEDNRSTMESLPSPCGDLIRLDVIGYGIHGQPFLASRPSLAGEDDRLVIVTQRLELLLTRAGECPEPGRRSCESWCSARRGRGGRS